MLHGGNKSVIDIDYHHMDINDLFHISRDLAKLEQSVNSDKTLKKIYTPMYRTREILFYYVNKIPNVILQNFIREYAIFGKPVYAMVNEFGVSERTIYYWLKLGKRTIQEQHFTEKGADYYDINANIRNSEHQHSTRDNG